MKIPDQKDILVVEDDPDMCLMISHMIRFAGYSLESIPFPERIREILERTNFHVILMDMLLSGADGKDICRSLKSDENTKDIYIIMMSAHPDAEQACRKAGADDFLEKPFDIHHFLEKLHALIPVRQHIS